MSDLHEANGARFLVADDMIVRWVRDNRQRFEPATTDWMIEAMEARGGAFVDVGASTGWFAIPMALRGWPVIGFEPFKAARDRLERNAAINGVAPLIVGAAAGAQRGRATFWRNPRVRLTSGGSIARPGSRGPAAEMVDVVPIDEIVAGLDVSVIKIDVEGHEIAVLDGARETLARSRPHLVLEANSPAERDALIGWLDAFGGYAASDADGRNLLARPV